MQNLVNNICISPDIFLTKKLDQLLEEFGGRRCKSMFEYGTGWNKQEDPGHPLTWPLTPSKLAAYAGDYKFTRDDMFGTYDNVYAEARDKLDGTPQVGVEAGI